MPKDDQADPRKDFVPRFLPWLLGGAMHLVYLVTLNHWVTLLNISQVATVSGWVWQPQIFNPLLYLVLLPFRWLPAAHIPWALNVLSALCGAATLAVLARSVAILPHDRTEMERMRESSDFSFLTGWVAWVPPVVAVVFGGLQLAFWENATSFSGESFELLWFAVILWQLLEYRMDEREGRLIVAAILYGAGMAENWAMVPFFPLFLIMLIWLRKLEFFNLGFLFRMIVCGLAGMLLYLLLPLVMKLSGAYPLTFWQALKFHLHSDWMVIRAIKIEVVRHDLALMSLTTLVPALIMSFRWSASFGDSSRLGSTLVNYLFHVVNAVIFGALAWVTFDPPFSARQLAQDMGINAPALTLHYLGALCIGYYCGYALLVFGKKPVPNRRTVKPEPALPEALLWLCPVVVAGTLAAVVLATGLLIYKNAPIIRAMNDDTLLKYAHFATQNLPRDGAAVLSDQPWQSFLAQAALAREGRANQYPVLDTQSLNSPPYHEYLHKRFPKIWPQTVTTNEAAMGMVPPLHLLALLTQLSKSNNLCYLNPSFGYYFEQFYQEPHGLIYSMKTLPEDTLLPPALDKNLIAENEAFWPQVVDRSRPTIQKALHPPNYKKQTGVVGWFMKHLHAKPEPNPNALFAGTIYSSSLNFLGVQVQRSVAPADRRAAELEQAATLFTEAKELNPDNVVAGINLAFNQNLRAGATNIVDSARVTPDQFGKYHNWNEVQIACGPFDETSFCFENGAWFMQAGLMHQALAAFNRVRQLAPDNLAARLFLAGIYIPNGLPDKALEVLRGPLTQPDIFALTEFNSTDLKILAAGAYFQKREYATAASLLESEISLHPDNETLLLMSAQSLVAHGLYTNALNVINHKLARTPDDPQWIYGKGIASLQVGAYNDAVAALSRILQMQTNNPDALFNRAIAYLQSDQLDAARADYRRLQSTYTNSFQVAYGLGEIAWRKHETNEAVRNYQIYLANANTNTAEAKTIRDRVTQLGGK